MALSLITKNKYEPISIPNKYRFVLFPIKNNDLWQLNKEAQNSFWTAEDEDPYPYPDFEQFKEQFSLEQQKFITKALILFTISVPLLQDNPVLKLMHEIQVPEIRCFYGWLISMENVHAEVYGTFMELFMCDTRKQHEFMCHINDDYSTELNQQIEYILNEPSIQKKLQWEKKWLSSPSLGVRLAAFAVTKGT